MARCNRPITQGFSSGHPGIDYGVPIGTPVYAPADGVVTRVRFLQTSYGHHVLFAAGPVTYLYAHLSTIPVREGARIRKGFLLAQTGNTGNVRGPTGAHLHYEVRAFGVHLDPTNYACPFSQIQETDRITISRDRPVMATARSSVQRKFGIQCLPPGVESREDSSFLDFLNPFSKENLGAVDKVLGNPLATIGYLVCVISSPALWIRIAFILGGAFAIFKGVALLTVPLVKEPIRELVKAA